MTEYIQSKSELLEQLRQQIDLISRAASSYDKGNENEALHLATSIRTIVYDKRHKSLLTHLNRKNILFYDSALPCPPPFFPSFFGLIRIRLSAPDGVSYYAPLENISYPRSNRRKIKFVDWWEGVVIQDEYGREFTRSHLILHVANKDGGAHVDSQLPQEYANLSRSKMSATKFLRKGVEQDYKNRAVFPSIRQIALEVLKTLKDEFPELFQGIRIRRETNAKRKS
jgi:hypothetical protein